MCEIRRWLRLAALPGLWLLVPGLAAAQVVSPDYEAVLRRYARGERATAVEALGRFRASDLDLQIQTLQRRAKALARCPSCRDLLDELPLKAAVLLHADRDEMDRPPAFGTEQPRQCPADNARRAGQIAAILAQRDATRDFARRFFLAMAQRCQWDFCLEAAEEWGRDGIERFPGDASLLLVAGATLEERATLEHAPEGERQRRFQEARRLLSDAVAADPNRFEARVRLGRVQWRLGDDEAARRTLEDAIARGGASSLVYLAQLFLGQAHERAGRADAAIEAFGRALALDPQSQAAAVALSEARLSSGDTAGARQALEQALAHAGRRRERDPHWDYAASNAAYVDDLFEDLRGESRQ